MDGKIHRRAERSIDNTHSERTSTPSRVEVTEQIGQRIRDNRSISVMKVRQPRAETLQTRTKYFVLVGLGNVGT